ncbi:hypothetical protein IAD21_04893 [Abditibacteriota bacterium]|nr:hypothetical protein IAD21_04893 [Abditibacteriota bacterium]
MNRIQIREYIDCVGLATVAMTFVGLGLTRRSLAVLEGVARAHPQQSADFVELPALVCVASGLLVLVVACLVGAQRGIVAGLVTVGLSLALFVYASLTSFGILWKLHSIC